MEHSRFGAAGDTLESAAEKMIRLEAENKWLRRFVPSVVREAIEKDPFTPPLCRLCRQTRDLTVLFADMAGCTRLCEVLPPERMQALIEEYFSSFIDEVHELGGTINETAGDGLMVLFTGEEPEEHALAAACAASLIHFRTREFEVCHEGECRDLAVHIGINSGTANLGVMEYRGRREVRATYTAIGPVTNLAARLTGLAPARKTYASEETWRRLNGAFKGCYAGSFELKNISRPVKVYDVTTGLVPSLSS
ncbi:MAG: adenylate/guanylate cyclase domain-containing protein [Candidatus Tectomicrobia bacterium]|nr:adenylate/guanylate cyclase domain-containing protein [Candidatus Tectomicrobia bacterium]